MAQALDGVSVVDLTEGVAGAIATMLLADHGAQVIRVDPPGAIDTRQEPAYAVWDRGKKSVFLDLSSDLSCFHSLVRSADVFIESCPPSSPLQSVVGYETLSQINPRLVHTSITAYGRDGPLKDEPAIDDLVVARVGILATTPTFRPGPPHLIHPIASVGAALLASIGTVAALFARERNGAGRKVDTSLMAGALLYSPKMASENKTHARYVGQPTGGGPFYSVMECSDGRWIQFGCVHQGFIDIAADVMGLSETLEEPRYGRGRNPETEDDRQELYDIVANVVRRRPYEEWAEMFERADVPYALACDIQEAFGNPQVLANGMVCELDDPVVGTMTQMGVPVHLSDTPGAVAGPRPSPGENTSDLLADLQAAPAGENTDNPAGRDALLPPPLQGVKVLEFTNVLAGPTVGKLWSDMGADVIKLEPPRGDISRPGMNIGFAYLNSNKRSISVDAKTPEGREITQRLAAQADILLANMRPGAAERVGVGTEALKRLNPDIIETHVTAFGWDGPYAHRAGVDPLAQAWIGMQRAQGGPHNPPVFLGGLAPTDYTGGALGALGGLLALFARERTGRGQRANANLLDAAILLSSDAFVRYDGKPPRRIADRGQYGLDALHRLYETSEGWLYLAADDPHHWPALCRTLDREDLKDDPRFASDVDRRANDDALAGELSESFRSAPRDIWIDRLGNAGVPIAPVVERYNVSFFDDAQALDNDMIGSWDHSVMGETRCMRNLVSFGRTSQAPACPTPLLGEHTREVLEEIEYEPSAIDSLFEAGVVRTRTAVEEAQDS